MHVRVTYVLEVAENSRKERSRQLVSYGVDVVHLPYLEYLDLP